MCNLKRSGTWIRLSCGERLVRAFVAQKIFMKIDGSRSFFYELIDNYSQ